LKNHGFAGALPFELGNTAVDDAQLKDLREGLVAGCIDAKAA